MIGNHKSREEACNTKSVDTTDSSKYHTITHSAYEQILQLNVPHWVQWWINREKQEQLKLSKLPDIKKGKQCWEVRESLFEKNNPTREKQILKSICPLLSIPKRTKRRYDNIFVWKKKLPDYTYYRNKKKKGEKWNYFKETKKSKSKENLERNIQKQIQI